MKTYIQQYQEDLRTEMLESFCFDVRGVKKAPENYQIGEEWWDVEMETEGKFYYKFVSHFTSLGVYTKNTKEFIPWNKLTNRDLAFYLDIALGIDANTRYSYSKRVRRYKAA